MAVICTVEQDGRLFPTDAIEKSTEKLIQHMQKEGKNSYEVDQGYKLEGSNTICTLRDMYMCVVEVNNTKTGKITTRKPIKKVEVQDGI